MSIIVSCSRGHNASTTLMVDGEVIFYVEEERLSRTKHDGGPLLGLIKVFEYVDHIDHLVICHTHRDGPTIDWTGEDLYHGLIRKLSKGKFEYKVYFVDVIHHEMHAACAFYNSGFKTAACVIADGAGSFIHEPEVHPKVMYEFETIFKAKYPFRFETVYKHMGTDHPVGVQQIKPGITYLTEYPGITKTYEAVTRYCGFSSIDAGKTMGLSPYGKENPEIPQLFNGKYSNRSVFIPTYPSGAIINKNGYEILNEDSKKHKPKEYTQVQKDLAYAVQKQSSDRMVELIRYAHEATGETNIVVCGGYGLNCVANYKYLKEFPDLNIYCEPIAHDGGTSLGGAKYIYSKLTRNKEAMSPQTSIYYGPKYDPKSYMDELSGYEVTDTSYDDVAKLIRDGNIVTIFQGRSEGGPRALGNRSILFDPTVKDGKDIVNKVKHREFFRPFACSIKKEAVHDWFDLAGREESPHMMYAVDALPGVAEKIPSVIHVDNTCRIQTVTPEQNEHYYNLIDAFEKLSEVPILFNTSFNLGGDPLVEQLEDAIDTLERCAIDWLYLPEIQKLVNIPQSKVRKSPKEFITGSNPIA